MERSLEGQAVRHAENHGWLCRKLQWIGRRGAPDRFCAKDGRVVLIEFKDPENGEVSGNQVREHAALRKAGVETHVVDSLIEFCAILGLPNVGTPDLSRR